LAEKGARCLHAPRDARKVKYDLLTLVRQRRFSIAQGYEDNYDAAALARDPAFKIVAGKDPESAGDLAKAAAGRDFAGKYYLEALSTFSQPPLQPALSQKPVRVAQPFTLTNNAV
jgi:hypothetical protein